MVASLKSQYIPTYQTVRAVCMIFTMLPVLVFLLAMLLDSRYRKLRFTQGRTYLTLLILVMIPHALFSGALSVFEAPTFQLAITGSEAFCKTQAIVLMFTSDLLIFLWFCAACQLWLLSEFGTKAPSWVFPLGIAVLEATHLGIVLGTNSFRDQTPAPYELCLEGNLTRLFLFVAIGLFLSVGAVMCIRVIVIIRKLTQLLMRIAQEQNNNVNLDNVGASAQTSSRAVTSEDGNPKETTGPNGITNEQLATRRKHIIRIGIFVVYAIVFGLYTIISNIFITPFTDNLYWIMAAFEGPLCVGVFAPDCFKTVRDAFSRMCGPFCGWRGSLNKEGVIQPQPEMQE